jgi:hypothetical protein
MSEPKSFEQFKLSPKEANQLSDYLGDERLLTREQAAEFLNVSSRTVDAWIANARMKGRRRLPSDAPQSNVISHSSERLPHVKLGHKVYVILGDLRRFRDERKVAA